MIVLDANILIRAILGRRVGQLLNQYSGLGIRFYAPESAFEEAEEYLPSLLRRRGRSDADLAATLRFLRSVVEPVESEAYARYENEARERLAGRDEEDWPVLAASLALSCPIWTEDADFFGTGASVWTTNRVELFLKSQGKQAKCED